MEYKVSIIMAVYNVAPFLNEAVDSLLQQTIGFAENVQLIMVDDGSQDGSGEICDTYKEQYPENIIVIHKENGGVASARNEGLKYAEGKYLNFMDSDDKFEVNALSKMYNFFEAHEGEIDIVTIPLQFFDAMTGEHWQNGKFKKGSRVIDLKKEPNATLMFVNASLFSGHLKNQILFDSTLPCGEDIKVIYTILLSKMAIGAVNDTCYWYRRRSIGNASLVATAHNKKNWYFEYFYNLQFWMLNYYKKEIGYIPDFVKCVFAAENQWRFRKDSNDLVQRKILNEMEVQKYKALLKNSIQEIDDIFLISQPFIYLEQKIFLLLFKYGVLKAQLVRYNDSIWVGYNDHIIGSIASVLLEVCLVSESKNILTIEGMINLPNIGANYKMGYKVNDNFFLAEWLPYTKDEKVLDNIILTKRAFAISINLSDICKDVYIKFAIMVDDACVCLSNIRYRSTSAITNKCSKLFISTNEHIIYAEKHWIGIIYANNKKKKEKRNAFLRELLCNKRNIASLKAFAIRSIFPLGIKLLKKKSIWLISDRYTKAGDNGEALFRYLQNKANIKSYFILFNNSVDYDRLKKVGKVIEPYSWKHKLLHLFSNVVISSHADDFVINPFRRQAVFYQDILALKKIVFLQHGVIINNVSEWYNRLKINASIFVTTAKPEYAAVCGDEYLYKKGQICLTGLPRYDYLMDESEKIISIMPTWRAYLVDDRRDGTGVRKLKNGFKKSTYYKMYINLLTNSKLCDAVKKYKYNIYWITHPNMSESLKEFVFDATIKIVPLDIEYKEIFSKSNLIVTDYSSVAFDMAYLRKPILYYQYDKDEFFSGAHTVQRGYFDYEKDGFGEVEYTLEDTVNRIIEYMENDCRLKDKYRERIDNFFAFNDKNNCQRVYEEILKLGD